MDGGDGMKRNTGTGIKGVYKQPGSSYQARITVDGIEYHLGMFRTKWEAKRVFDEAWLNKHNWKI